MLEGTEFHQRWKRKRGELRSTNAETENGGTEFPQVKENKKSKKDKTKLENKGKIASMIKIREFKEEDLPELINIWNDVIKDGRAFPQVELLKEENAQEFFASQTYTGVAECKGEVLGLYILHPNDIGRKAHVANASYAVHKKTRGRGIGRMLVADSLKQLKPRGFIGMQFNAVVASNIRAIALYESLGFKRIGTIPSGFRNIDEQFEDMHIYYHEA